MFSFKCFNIARALVNLIYQVVGLLRWPKALQMYKNLAQFTESNSPAAQRSLAHVIIIAKLKNLSFTDSTAQLQIHFEIWPFNHLSRYLGGQDRCFVTENREENLSKLPWLSDRIWARKIDDKQIELTELKTVGEEALSSNLRILEFIVWVYGLANPKFTRSHKEH